MTRSPFVGQIARANDILEIIHSDVCGPLVKWLGVVSTSLLPLLMIYQGMGNYFL